MLRKQRQPCKAYYMNKNGFAYEYLFPLCMGTFGPPCKKHTNCRNIIRHEVRAMDYVFLTYEPQ